MTAPSPPPRRAQPVKPKPAEPAKRFTLADMLKRSKEMFEINTSNIKYNPGIWDKAKDDCLQLSDAGIIPYHINVMLWDARLGLYLKRGHTKQLRLGGISLIGVEIRNLHVQINGVGLVFGVLGVGTDRKTRHQYKQWKCEKLAKDPDFFEERDSGNVFDSEAMFVGNAGVEMMDKTMNDMLGRMFISLLMWLVDQLFLRGVGWRVA